MSELPAVGDPITAMVTSPWNWVAAPCCGKVTLVFPSGNRFDEPEFRWVGPQTETTFVLREEGTNWIRGCHLPDSEEGLALLAAYTLVRAHS